MAIINERIKQRRLEMGFTLQEIADFLGVKEATAQRYESGAIKSIGHETIIKLSDILKCSPSFLMGWKESVLGLDNDQRIARMSKVDKEMLSYFEKIKALPRFQREIIYNMIDNMKTEEPYLLAAHEDEAPEDEKIADLQRFKEEKMKSNKTD